MRPRSEQPLHGPGRRRAARVAASVAAVGALLLHGTWTEAAPSPAETRADTVSELVVTAIKTVEELVVTAPVGCQTPAKSYLAPRRPIVVSSYPANGQVVRPGLVVIRVTFDAPVACTGGLSNDPPLADPCPGRVQHMVLSYDRRTVRTVCLLDPEKRYGTWLNWWLSEFTTVMDGDPRLFVGLNRVPVKPFLLRFASSLDAPVTNVCEALLADTEGLLPADMARLGDCKARDPTADVVAADVVRLDAQARLDEQARRDRARASAELLARQSPDRREAADLARAVDLGLAAYGEARDRARDREWAKLTIEAGHAAAAPEDSRLVTDQSRLERPSQAGGALDPRSDTEYAVLPPAPARAKRTPPASAMPELLDWRDSVTVDDKVYDCAFKQDHVVCRRH